MMEPFDEIRDRLCAIEREESVRIFYACESGSRAWGFPSANSDYDVRFLYIREPEYYLSIDVEDRRDVIELPIVDEFDINGWDLRKALKLLRKSNPPLLEWLNSPTIYKEDIDLSSKFKELAPLCYSATSCTYHYLQMAKGNYREYLRGDTVSVKKYFYVLRPLMAIKWIEHNDGVVPMEFGKLVKEVIADEVLLSEINTLIERKKQGDELKREPRIDVISEFIESEMTRLSSIIVDRREDKPKMALLNKTFREMLDVSQSLAV